MNLFWILNELPVILQTLLHNIYTERIQRRQLKHNSITEQLLYIFFHIFENITDVSFTSDQLVFGIRRNVILNRWCCCNSRSLKGKERWLQFFCLKVKRRRYFLELFKSIVSGPHHSIQTIQFLNENIYKNFLLYRVRSGNLNLGKVLVSIDFGTLVLQNAANYSFHLWVCRILSMESPI